MLTSKRVIITTICGFIFGLVCMSLATSNPNPDPANLITTQVIWLIIISRTLMGFMIGISALNMKWWLHGIVIGFISSIPMALSVMDKTSIMIGTFVMGIIYGFLTELITSILFKSKPVSQIKIA